MKHASIIILSIVICLVQGVSAFVNTIDSEKSVSYEGKPLYGLGRDTVGLDTIPPSCGDHPDYAPLMALYHATDGPNWKNNKGWVDGAKGTNCDPCNKWKGVSCNDDGRVFQLQLSSNKLKLYIPKELMELTYLRELDLEKNALIGSLPKELSNLTQLRYLNIMRNRLSGIIPKELGDMDNLEFLYLSRNELSGEIPKELGNLNKLKYLDLSVNKLNGEIPSALGRMTSLQKLILRRNMLSGMIPKELCKLKELRQLSLRVNNLNSIPSEIGQLSKLRILSIGENKLTCKLPKELGQLVNLEILNLANNSLQDSIPKEIGKLRKLNDLFLSFNQLRGSIPKDLSNIESLHSLDLAGNNLDGNIPKELGQLVNLFRLDLSYNELSGIIPKEFGNLKNLAHLNLANNKLTGSIPLELGSLSNLVDIQLNDNRLSGSIPALNNAKNLRFFYCSSNNLSGSLPVKDYCKLGSNQKKEFRLSANGRAFLYYDNSGFDLTGNPLLPWGGDYQKYCEADGDISSQIGAPCSIDNKTGVINELYNCVLTDYRDTLRTEKNKETIKLSCGDHPDYEPLIDLYNATDGPNWKNNMGWSDGVKGTNCDPCNEWKGVKCENNRVVQLELFRNGLNGYIPETIQKLTSLKHISLEGNALKGSISRGVLSLKKLEYLNLSHNQLTGQIPRELADTKSMKHLNLGYNNLSGVIPREFGELYGLRSLSIECNKIEGSIPEELVYLSELNSLILRNNKLSGELPSNLSLLKALHDLDLSENEFRGMIPENLNELKYLEALILSDNKLHGEIPEEISLLRFLAIIDLANNQLTGTIPHLIGDMHSLRVLDLGSNSLVGSIPMSIGKLQGLNKLFLNNNNLTGSIPSFDDATSLNSFYCSSNNLSGCYPSRFLCDHTFVPSKDLYHKMSGYNLTNNPHLPWSGDYIQYCQSEEGQDNQIGAPCELDGIRTAINERCLCGDIDTISFVTTWQTNNRGSSCNTCISIPTNPNYQYDYSIDWNNDGIIDTTGIKGDIIHDFGVLGIYTFSIRGDFPGIYFNANGSVDRPKGDEAKILSIDQWGTQQWKTMNSAFKGCHNLKMNANDIPDLRKAKNLKDMFFGVVSELDLSSWLTSGVPDMSGMLDGANITLDNYDTILKRWAANTKVPRNISLGAKGLQYCKSQAARDSLVNIMGWTITGDTLVREGDYCRNKNGLYRVVGKDCSCVDPPCGDHPDYAPLMALYNSMDGANWYMNDGWEEGVKGTNCDPCNGWDGVICSDGRVTNLKLGNRLKGRLPKELAKLGELKELVIGGSEIIGHIPREFGELDNLEVFILFGTQIEGAFPKELGRLKKLKYFAFSSSESDSMKVINIPKDFLELSNLEILQISNIKIEGVFLDEFMNFGKLKKLILVRNDLGGRLPNEIGQLKNLTDLEISNNHIEGNIPNEIGQLSKLKFLNLKRNRLTGNIPKELGRLTDLRRLYLNQNMLDGEIPRELGNLVKLSILEMRNNKLHGEIPNDLMKASKLNILDLRNNNLEGNIPKDIGKLEKLVALVISNNRLNGEIPKGLGNLRRLIVLLLNDNMLSGSIPNDMGKLINVKTIRLDSNQLSGSIPYFRNNNSLGTFNLSNNNFSGCLQNPYLCDKTDTYVLGATDTLAVIPGYDFSQNLLLPWEGDLKKACGTDDRLKPQIKAPCKINGKPGIINENCECVEVME